VGGPIRPESEILTKARPTTNLIHFMDIETTNDKYAVQYPDLPRLCHTIFDGSPLPTAVVEGDKHTLRYVNPAFCRLAGTSKEHLIGKLFGEILPGDECQQSLDRIYRTGEAEIHLEPERTEANSVCWSYTMWPVKGADERITGVMIQVTETARFRERATSMNQELLLSGLRQHELIEVAGKLNAQLQQEMAERKRMEQALLNSAMLAATTRLASTMAHEVNNPLAAITNLIFLLIPLQTSPEAKAYITSLEKQVKGLARIATQMLKFHRDNNRPTEFELGELLPEISDIYRPQAKSQGVTIIERVETEGMILGFRGEIIQVLNNLLLNSLEATAAGGKIRIHLYPAPPWLCAVHKRCGYCLSIMDTGSGIDPEDYGRIFEPFFTTKGDKGTGLGLWLCSGIVNRVGGSIRVRSSRMPGRSGTCFSVFLPAEEANFAQLRRRFERDDSAGQKKKQYEHN
jgi:two-component system NtrC family sensor kinase